MMRYPPFQISANADFWPRASHYFCAMAQEHAIVRAGQRDFSALRVIVPTYAQASLFLNSLRPELGENFVPPRINTLFAWLEMLPPTGDALCAASNGERLMDLYAELRQHAWLKKLFSARKNTDLLPLAQTLLDLADELTQAGLANIGAQELSSQQIALRQKWHTALAQLSPSSQKILSEEAQLVWTIWQGQLEARDASLLRHQKLTQELSKTSEYAKEPLFWISSVAPDATEQAFLYAYAQRQAVFVVTLDWRPAAVGAPYRSAWAQLFDAADSPPPQQAQFNFDVNNVLPAACISAAHISLLTSNSLEEEAQLGAQTIVDWLKAGNQAIAVIAQDRSVTRRMRALLERASVFVADETGWKLSTTRSAAALAAWFDVIATRADSLALLDFLKSPYLIDVIDVTDSAAEEEDKTERKANRIMQIEFALRRNNVAGGWEAILFALDTLPAARSWIARIARLAATFAARRTLSEWAQSSVQALHELDMYEGLAADSAGQQIIQLLLTINNDGKKMPAPFSFAEWRAFINVQMESEAFIAPRRDHRVVMLPLNGARLRRFDAVLVVGADAAHLPSAAQETLFFSDAVKRELGLTTRDARQRQQLRDFAEVLLSNPIVVLSWQAHQRSEHNPVSPWIAQLQLALQRGSEAPLLVHEVKLASHTLTAVVSEQPRPSAAALRPSSLSASGFASLRACPYQFFAGRMLQLSAIDVLSDMPEKRDYGDWLHSILKNFHDVLLTQPEVDKQTLLTQLSDASFATIVKRSPAALGYSVRWEKVIPAYVQWVEQHEREGWQFEVGELWRERMLQWETGEIKLRGRLDRVDRNAVGDTAVLDYKTTTPATLKKRLFGGEDHQLPFYALMLEPAPVAAKYVALEMQYAKTGEAAAQDLPQWTAAVAQSIINTIAAIDRGAGLPAQGPETVCRYCDMRGLCRKGAW